MAPTKPKQPKPSSPRLRAGSKSPSATQAKASAAKRAKAPASTARAAKAGEPSGKKQASRQSKAEPMLPKVRLTAEVLAGG